MSSLTKPNGPLPETVYWRRRALVFAIALLVVVGLGGFFTRGSDAGSGATASAGDSASLVSTVGEAARTAATPESGMVVEGPRVPGIEPSPSSGTKKNEAKKKTDDSVSVQPTVEPRGECLPSDVVVEPRVATQPAGQDIAVRLLVSAKDSEACLWTASEETLTLKITSGKDSIWFSSECPKALPDRSLVVRNDKAKVLRLTWDARRSDEGCTNQRLWSLPGTYHMEAAALGGDPADERFMLETPEPKSVTPKSKKSDTSAGDQQAGDQKSGDQKSGDKKASQKKKSND